MANPNTLNYLKYQDIQISDSNAFQQFQQYYKTGQYAEAFAIANSAQFNGKSYIANTINIIINGVLELESYFNNGVNLYLFQLAAQYQNLISNFLNRNQWYSSVQYNIYNFVLYDNNLYICLNTPPAGTPPTNTEYWLLLGLRGENGAYGTDVSLRYNWNSAVNYSQNDLVVYNNNIYVALQSNVNIIPNSNPEIWLLFLAINPGEIFVGVESPDYPLQNVIWFQTKTNPLSATSDTPIYGQFNRYVEETSSWEPMYPNVLFNWMDISDNYPTKAILMDIDILPNQWQNNQYTFSLYGVQQNSLINILPNSIMTEGQYYIYNQLSITVNEDNVILTVPNVPEIDLPIIVKFQ